MLIKQSFCLKLSVISVDYRSQPANDFFFREEKSVDRFTAAATTIEKKKERIK